MKMWRTTSGVTQGSRRMSVETKPSRRMSVETKRSRRRSVRETGFTIIELMVVVVIISVFAALAVPAMLDAGNDRKAFEMAHRTAQLLQSARARAMSTGSAHLVTMTSSGFGSSATPGQILVFQGYFNLAASPNGTATASCTNSTQWTALPTGGVPPFPIGPSNILVDGLNYKYSLDSPLESQFVFNGGAATTTAALCFTPGGRVYYASTVGGLSAAGIRPLAAPFEVQVRRFNGATPVGLTRSVTIDGSDMARVRSY
jgi:prepilin-type N-terminal cleavage/methylation domain-containing protein